MKYNIFCLIQFISFLSLLCSQISQYSGVHRTFDSGAMAKVSDGYTIGSVATCIREVITCKRMLQLRVKPLTHVELINALRFYFYIHQFVLVAICFSIQLLIYFQHKRASLSRGRRGFQFMVGKNPIGTS